MRAAPFSSTLLSIERHDQPWPRVRSDAAAGPVRGRVSRDRRPRSGSAGSGTRVPDCHAAPRARRTGLRRRATRRGGRRRTLRNCLAGLDPPLAASLVGEWPRWRSSSRLDCDGLRQPTRVAADARPRALVEHQRPSRVQPDGLQLLLRRRRCDGPEVDVKHRRAHARCAVSTPLACRLAQQTPVPACLTRAGQERARSNRDPKGWPRLSLGLCHGEPGSRPIRGGGPSNSLAGAAL
jgi:hypothetical protein